MEKDRMVYRKIDQRRLSRREFLHATIAVGGARVIKMIVDEVGAYLQEQQFQNNQRYYERLRFYKRLRIGK